MLAAGLKEALQRGGPVVNTRAWAVPETMAVNAERPIRSRSSRRAFGDLQTAEDLGFV